MDDSIIILADSKYGEPSKWQFPEDIDTCPVSSCKKKFENRLALINHYRRFHAKYFTMCSICEIPVGLKYFNDHEKTSRHRIARSTKKVATYETFCITVKYSNFEQKSMEIHFHILFVVFFCFKKG